jgi:hypothetical protein
MAYYPETGDVKGWFAWYREHNPGCTEEQAYSGVLFIFEAEVWCQRTKVRNLRLRYKPLKNSTDFHTSQEFSDAVASFTHFLNEQTKLERMLVFLTGDTTHHRAYTFKQFREKLRHGRTVYAMFNSIPADEPYDEIEMEVVRCQRV